MEVIKIPDQFIGGGEVSGFLFKKEFENEDGYVFSVSTEGGVHFEVFKKVLSPICLDFSKREYSTDTFKETYPKSSSFGVTAWNCASVAEGIKKLQQ
jgi:hypothetical protein